MGCACENKKRMADIAKDAFACKKSRKDGGESIYPL